MDDYKFRRDLIEALKKIAEELEKIRKLIDREKK